MTRRRNLACRMIANGRLNVLRFCSHPSSFWHAGVVGCRAHFDTFVSFSSDAPTHAARANHSRRPSNERRVCVVVCAHVVWFRREVVAMTKLRCLPLFVSTFSVIVLGSPPITSSHRDTTALQPRTSTRTPVPERVLPHTIPIMNATPDDRHTVQTMEPLTASDQRTSVGAMGSGHANANKLARTLGCYCGIDTEGQDFCFLDEECVNVTACRSSTECPSGFRCVANNCCSTPLDFACFLACTSPSSCNNGNSCSTVFESCSLSQSNDLCGDAQLINSVSTTGSTVGATTDLATDCPTTPDGPGVWYRVVGTGSTMAASTCSEFNSNPDTEISVFCAGCENLRCVAGNDDECALYSGLLSTIRWCSELGREYLILVHDFSATSGSGGFTLNVWDDNITCTTPLDCAVPPPHDDCGGCLPVTTGVPFNGSTADATGTDVTSCTVTDTADVWHCWTADCTGEATFSLCGSTFDTSLAVYDNCSGLELGCDDDGCSLTTQSELRLNVTSGTPFWVRVAGYQGATGDYELKVTCTPETGACCDGLTGVCQDGTAAIDCQTPSRFAANTLCADLIPPCATPVSACCSPDGRCTESSAADCRNQGDTPQSTGTTCLSLTCPRDCVSCDPSSTMEGEANCGLPIDSVNGGCNTSPPLFSRIGCGEVYCGTVSRVDDTRDTDWYAVEVAEPTRFTWTVTSEFDAVIGLAATDPPGTGICADSTGSLDPFVMPALCTTGSVSTCLPRGAYWFFVAPDFTAYIDCGAEYEATLTCEPCRLGACCVNGTCVGTTEQLPCLNAGGAWSPDANCDTSVCPEACCLPNGGCVDVPPVECLQRLGVSRGSGTNCGLPADLDGNGGVSLSDWASIPACMGGPAMPVGTTCVIADLNCDGIVDLKDARAFQTSFGP